MIDEQVIQDVLALAVPAGVDPSLPGFTEKLAALVETSVWNQFPPLDRPESIRFESVEWLITQDAAKVEAFQPAHDCASCRASNDQMLTFLREHPTRWVALANLTYTEVWDR